MPLTLPPLELGSISDNPPPRGTERFVTWDGEWSSRTGREKDVTRKNSSEAPSGVLERIKRRRMKKKKSNNSNNTPLRDVAGNSLPSEGNVTTTSTSKLLHHHTNDSRHNLFPVPESLARSVSRLNPASIRWMNRHLPHNLDVPRHRILPEDALQLRDIFRGLDFNNQGALNLDEMRSALIYVSKLSTDSNQVPLVNNPDQIINFFTKMDTNGDGKIDFDEFVVGMTLSNSLSQSRHISGTSSFKKSAKPLHPHRALSPKARAEMITNVFTATLKQQIAGNCETLESQSTSPRETKTQRGILTEDGCLTARSTLPSARSNLPSARSSSPRLTARSEKSNLPLKSVDVIGLIDRSYAIGGTHKTPTTATDEDSLEYTKRLQAAFFDFSKKVQRDHILSVLDDPEPSDTVKYEELKQLFRIKHISSEPIIITPADRLKLVRQRIKQDNRELNSEAYQLQRRRELRRCREALLVKSMEKQLASQGTPLQPSTTKKLRKIQRNCAEYPVMNSKSFTPQINVMENRKKDYRLMTRQDVQSFRDEKFAKLSTTLPTPCTMRERLDQISRRK